MKAAFCV